jgi:CubicO group peptidase (beta-lactamase class C family)
MLLQMIARKAAVGFLIVLAAVTAASATDERDDGRLKRENLGGIATLIRTEMAERHIPGAVVMIQRQGKTLYLESFGWRDEAKKVPMTTDTIFQIYSMTKPITTVAALMLVDDGKLRLDDPVAKYIPAFADTKVGVERKNAEGATVLELVPQERPMTIEDLMRHSSGITTGSYGDSLVRKAYAASNLYEGDFDNAQLADRVARLPLAEQPGTEWDYGLSTDVLGRVRAVAVRVREAAPVRSAGDEGHGLSPAGSGEAAAACGAAARGQRRSQCPAAQSARAAQVRVRRGRAGLHRLRLRALL